MVCLLFTFGIALVLTGILVALRSGRTGNARRVLWIGAIVCGLALLILSTLPPVADFSPDDWHTDRWVIDGLRSDNPQRRSRCIAQLPRRLQKGTLDASELRMIVVAALERATAGRHYDALRTLAAIAECDVLTPSDAERLLTACGDGVPRLRMRGVLALGLPSPFAINFGWPRIDVDSVDMDGRGIEWTRVTNDIGPDGGLIVPDALGTQVVQLHCTARARLARTPGVTLPLTLEHTVSVAAAPEEVVETITQPDIDAAVRHSVLRTSV